MRLRDGSSDLCSSDLPAQPGPRQAAGRGGEQVEQPGGETGHAGECSERMRVPRAGGLNVRGGGNDGAKAMLPKLQLQLQLQPPTPHPTPPTPPHNTPHPPPPHPPPPHPPTPNHTPPPHHHAARPPHPPHPRRTTP